MVSSERKWEGLKRVITDKMEKKIYKNGIILFKGRYKINGGKNYCGIKRERNRIEVNDSKE
jgi:hypothetical protein